MKSLPDQFRPHSLAEIRGQPKIIKAVAAKLRMQSSFAIIACGEPGIGKTSLGYAIAAELGASVDGSEAQRISTGFWLVPANDQGIDRIEEIFEHCRYRPMAGSLWWILVFEEADCMSRQAVNYLKTRLENLPRWTVVIFTSNKPLREFAEPAIQERCLCLTFEHDAGVLWNEAQALVQHAWESTLKRNHAPSLEDLGISRLGRLSFRAVLSALEPLLLAELPDNEPGETREPITVSQAEPLTVDKKCIAEREPPAIVEAFKPAIGTRARAKNYRIRGCLVEGVVSAVNAAGTAKVGGLWFALAELEAA